MTSSLSSCGAVARSFRKATAAFLSASLFASGGMAATIVDWGGNYVAATTSLETGSSQATGDGQALTYLYSANTAKSPASGYTAPAGKSDRFYGAFQSEKADGGASFEVYSIVEKGSSDWLQVSGVTDSALQTKRAVTGLAFFKKDDFLNGADAANIAVRLDATSSLNVTIANVPTATREVRAAVYASVGGTWNWYLSSAVYKLGAASISLTDLGTTGWSLWNIASTTAPLNPISLDFNVPGTNFEDIGALGLYFSITTQTGRATAPGIAFSAISFNATTEPIPEPNTSALLLLGSIGLASWRFAKRKTGRRQGCQ